MTMPVNKKHLLKIKQHILEEPNRLAMDNWIQKHEPGTCISDSYSLVIEQIVPSCGTTGCLAGWSALLRGLDESCFDKYLEAHFLGIPSSIFFVDNWPNPYRDMYQESISTLEKALVLGKFIDLIIENEDELELYNGEEEYDEKDYKELYDEEDKDYTK
jgi:hypothetical protein